METKFGSTATLSSFTNDSASMNVLSMKGTRNLVHFVTTKPLRKKVEYWKTNNRICCVYYLGQTSLKS